MKTPTLFISVLVTLLWWTLATGASAQPEAKAISTANAAPAAQPDSSPADNDLKFVVALFRHGVRAPLKAFGNNADQHSGSPWPSATPWGVANWGDLTPHGFKAVRSLGEWYGSHYSKRLGDGFKAYLWADVDERTQQTALALAKGFGKFSVKVKMAPPPGPGPDPLFHPFQASCGTPDTAELDRIANQIKAECREWLCSHKDQLTKLDEVLACPNERGNPTCVPLGCVGETVTPWATPTPRPSAAPIKWDGQFSYASSATEAFLLEYANKMDPGWGQVEVGQQTGSRPRLSDLLQLHEFYFDKTEREEYLAGLQGANLVREILEQLNRGAGQPPPTERCPHGEADDKFVGLVGHDTNLANLNTLLNVSWKFNNPKLPDDTRNLPDNDALPAGALVFELHKGSPDYRVRIQYVAQSLGGIRNAPQPADAYRVQTTCGDESGPCEMPLEQFNKVAGDVIKKYGPFLSNCQNGKQTCP
jgi:4-phytase/acid phosphatase